MKTNDVCHSLISPHAKFCNNRDNENRETTKKIRWWGTRKKSHEQD